MQITYAVVFALDRTNYARWLPVHIRDMESLGTELPAVAAEFRKGHFVIDKTNRAFSLIPINQAHEQNNKIVKGDGGIIGLTEGSTQLPRWMVSGPEISREISNFQLCQELVKNTSQHEEPGTHQGELRHHENMRGVQNTFQNQVKAVCNTIKEMDNPFTDQTRDKFVLYNRDTMDSKVVETVKTVVQLGKEQYEEFVTKRLQERKTPLFYTIHRNKLPLFSSPPAPRREVQR